MFILVINCGSSSAKYQLFNVGEKRSLARGIVERIGHPGSALSHQLNGKVLHKKVSCRDHYVAIEVIIDILTDKRHGVIESKSDILGIGHRVVHGGEEFKESTLITKKVVASVEKYSELAPLHNPPSLLGIKACLKVLKNIPQVAVFDTSFHQTMKPEAFLYGLPLEYYKKYGIRKYGFHGTSHRYVAEEAARILRQPLSGLKTYYLSSGQRLQYDRC